MAYFLSPVLNEQQFDANGDPLAGGMIYTYLAGTTTPVTTYKTSTGTAQTNPIVLDSSGNYPTGTQLWLDGGASYKFVIQDSLGATLRTIDNISGVNDSNVTPDEWTPYTLSAFTYLSATSFSVVGDQTNIFQVNRRVRTQNTGGLIYSTIQTSVYSAPNTTVTLVNDSGVLDAGLSAVSYSLLSSINPSLPKLDATYWQMNTSRLLGRTTASAGSVEEISVGTGLSLTGGVLSASQIQSLLSPTFNAGAMIIPAMTLSLDFRSSTLGNGSSVPVSGTTASLTISSGSTLGTTSAVQSDIAVLAINNAGTIELAVVNVAGGVDLSESGLISTTAEGGAGGADSANVIYSTTARSNVAYRVLGIYRSTQATAGTWATAPSLIQGASDLPLRKLVPLVSTVRVYGATGYGSTNTKIRRFTTTDKNIGTAITYADSAANGGSFTINENGIYSISYGDQFSGTATFGISLNSAQLTTNYISINQANALASDSTNGANTGGNASWTGQLVVGDVIRAHADGTAAGTSVALNQFTITRVA